MPERIAAALRGLLPGTVAVAVADPRLPPPPLWPGEALAGATPARLREFATGRGAVRAALAQLGLPGGAIPAGPDRAPVWPEGVTGSISHTAAICLAAVARAGDAAALGIDIEPETALSPDLWPEVCTAAEQSTLARLPQPDRARQATLIFCAKEAAYKAHYPVSRTLIGFDALHIDADAQGGFRATFRIGVTGFAPGAVLHGRWARASGHLIAAVLLPHQRV